MFVTWSYHARQRAQQRGINPVQVEAQLQRQAPALARRAGNSDARVHVGRVTIGVQVQGDRILVATVF